MIPTEANGAQSRSARSQLPVAQDQGVSSVASQPDARRCHVGIGAQDHGEHQGDDDGDEGDCGHGSKLTMLCRFGF